MAKIMVTGSAGFIGYHVSERLLARGDEVGAACGEARAAGPQAEASFAPDRCGASGDRQGGSRNRAAFGPGRLGAGL